MIPRLIFPLVIALAAVAPPAAAQQPPVEVRWSPVHPTPGTLLRIAAKFTTEYANGDAALGGSLAGQPLHFSRTADSLIAYAGIPVDSPDTISVAVTVSGPDGAEALLELPIALHVEPAPPARTGARLNVAPRFSRQPDSATAARMARESAMAMEVARRAHETPRLWDEPFARPRPSRITSAFGTGRVFNGAVQSRHLGVDLAGDIGAPVRAANRGVVALVADFYLAGTAIYVDHGEGLVTGYFHLSKAEVAAGDTVARGAIIGRVGATGRVTGPHLHWIARYGTVTVDPLSVVTATEGLATRD
ncbi:MAG TPA: M23 family metallopeptidase [Gemmatimonadaceae bacterium]|nr:M23 family metallopeptidase [Gemmatimonadaceae bacterium]